MEPIIAKIRPTVTIHHDALDWVDFAVSARFSGSTEVISASVDTVSVSSILETGANILMKDPAPTF